VDYIDLPKIIAFELRDRSTVLDAVVSVRQLTGTDLNYRLAGIVYFGNMHFVVRIIRQNGQIWFHDGITTHCNLIYEESIGSGQIDLSSAHSKDAHTGIYNTSSCGYTYVYKKYVAVPHLSKVQVIGLFSSWHEDD